MYYNWRQRDQTMRLTDIQLFLVDYLSLPHEPEFENVRSAAALKIFVSNIPFGVVEFVLLEEINGWCRVGLKQHVLIAYEKCGALLGHSEQFVRIPRHGIRSTEQIEQVRDMPRFKFWEKRAGFEKLYLSMPLSRGRYFRDINIPPPQAASTCIHIPNSWHKSAISSKGSIAPSTVVPTVSSIGFRLQIWNSVSYSSKARKNDKEERESCLQ